MNRATGFRPCDSYDTGTATYRERILESGDVVLTITGDGTLTMSRSGEADETEPLVAGDIIIIKTLPNGQHSITKL